MTGAARFRFLRRSVVAVETVVLRRARLLRTEVSSTARSHGWRAAGRAVLRHAVGGCQRLGAYLAETAVDLWLGARTRGVVNNEDVTRARGAGGDPVRYQAVALRKWRRMLAALDLDPAETSFIDLGSGRGRALMLAERAGFARVAGYELDPALAVEAERNLARHGARRGRPARSVVHVRDAVDVDLPSGPVVVFLYNPFGPVTLRAVLTRILAAHSAAPRDLRVCYVNTQHAEVLEEHPALVPVARDDDWCLYAVRAA